MMRRLACSLSAFLFLTTTAVAQSDYKHYAYGIEFSGSDFGGSGNYGNTKTVFTEASDVSVTSSNTCQINIAEWQLRRTLTNRPVLISDNDLRFYNGYSTQLSPQVNQISGTVSDAPNGVMDVSVGSGEETEVIPFYFNSTTNVALHISQDDSGEQSLGVLLKKGAGMSAASADGTYMRCTISQEFFGQEALGEGWGAANALLFETSLVQFDSAGGMCMSHPGTEAILTRSAGETESQAAGETVVDTYSDLYLEGTNTAPWVAPYMIFPGGELTIFVPETPIEGQLSADGDLLVMQSADGVSNDYAEVSLTLALRMPSATVPTDPIERVYFIMELCERFEGASATAGTNRDQLEVMRSYLYLHDDATFQMQSDARQTVNQMDNFRFIAAGESDYVSANDFTTEPGRHTIEFETGTYVIDPSGLVTLTFDNGDTGQAQLSDNGEYLVSAGIFPDADGSERNVILGIHRIPPPAPSGPVEIGSMVFSATNLALSAQIPTNCAVEIVRTADLADGSWFPVEVVSNATGSVVVYDGSVSNEPHGFYSATAAPW